MLTNHGRTDRVIIMLNSSGFSNGGSCADSSNHTP
jgi:hypothetical protein